MAIFVGKASGEALDQKKDTQTSDKHSQKRKSDAIGTCASVSSRAVSKCNLLLPFTKVLRRYRYRSNHRRSCNSAYRIFKHDWNRNSRKTWDIFRKEPWSSLRRSFFTCDDFLRAIFKCQYIYSHPGSALVATVPLTAGIISTMFGPRYMATLQLPLSHQLEEL